METSSRVAPPLCAPPSLETGLSDRLGGLIRVRELVDADAPQPVEPVGRQPASDDATNDLPDRRPRDADARR